MANLHEINDYLDSLLQTKYITDYSGALNGLQIENSSKNVSKVVSAVDASLPVIKKAVTQKADLLIVHHGLFWHAPQRYVGHNFEKLRLCIENNLAVYSSHLPLDIHPVHGNNQLLAEIVGLSEIESFGDLKGNPMGLKGTVDHSLSELLRILEEELKAKIHHCPGRGENLGRVGIITGGAGSEIGQISEYGVDTLITGEGPHWSFPLAEELEKNLIYAGHYATETLGVKSLGLKIEADFSISHQFIDHPTGL